MQPARRVKGAMGAVISVLMATQLSRARGKSRKGIWGREVIDLFWGSVIQASGAGGGLIRQTSIACISRDQDPWSWEARADATVLE